MVSNFRIKLEHAGGAHWKLTHFGRRYGFFQGYTKTFMKFDGISLHILGVIFFGLTLTGRLMVINFQIGKY